MTARAKSRRRQPDLPVGQLHREPRVLWHGPCERRGEVAHRGLVDVVHGADADRDEGPPPAGKDDRLPASTGEAGGGECSGVLPEVGRRVGTLGHGHRDRPDLVGAGEAR